MNKKKPNPIDIHVGSRVRLRRMLVGMSQEKLGEKLGLTFQQVQKYEKGTNRIGASRLFTIANILGVEVQFFFEDMPGEVLKALPTQPEGGFGDADAAPFIMDFVSSSEGLQLNRFYSDIESTTVRKRVLDLIKSLAQEA